MTRFSMAMLALAAALGGAAASAFAQDAGPTPWDMKQDTGYAYDNPCYAAYNPASPVCTFSSGGRTASFAQTGGKKAQAMFAMDVIFHF